MKRITKDIIKQLRNYIEQDYADNHIKEPSSDYGSDNIAFFIDRIIRFSDLLPQQLSELERATLLYHIVTKTVTYDYDESNEKRYSYYQAVFKGSAVCMGIAELYSILCIVCRLRCRIIVGISTDSQKEDTYHAWNQIRIEHNGITAWYMADPTWDLSEYNHTWKYFLKSNTYFRLHGHYWLDCDYEKCEFNIENNIVYPDSTIDRVVEIFREVVCDAVYKP